MNKRNNKTYNSFKAASQDVTMIVELLKLNKSGMALNRAHMIRTKLTATHEEIKAHAIPRWISADTPPSPSGYYDECDRIHYSDPVLVVDDIGGMFTARYRYHSDPKDLEDNGTRPILWQMFGHETQTPNNVTYWTKLPPKPTSALIA